MIRILPLLALLTACAGIPVPQPQGADAAVLVVRSHAIGYVGRGVTRTPHKVYFARLSDEGSEIIESNYYRGPLAFAFNVRPGRYAVVCLVTVWEGKDRFVFLPEATINARHGQSIESIMTWANRWRRISVSLPGPSSTGVGSAR